MIRTVKPTAIPDKLTEDGQAENQRNENDYDADELNYIEGKSNFDIKPEIYNAPGIKAILKEAQHNKCCFCEKEQDDEYGAVEHYRPKAGYQSARKTKLIKPGYYWLGYEWSNLYFVCGPCNTLKGNLFPLANGEKRMASHHDKHNIPLEEPYILEPDGAKDPRDHITFDFEFVRGITIYGRETVDACGLDRDGLNEKRKKLLSDIYFRIGILFDEQNHPIDTVEKSREFLRKCRHPTAEFSAAAIDYLSKFNI